MGRASIGVAVEAGMDVETTSGRVGSFGVEAATGASVAAETKSMATVAFRARTDSALSSSGFKAQPEIKKSKPPNTQAATVRDTGDIMIMGRWD
jgi:hypothetical protein